MFYPREIRLWSHQEEAVAVIDGYLSPIRPDGKKPKAALVNIPTGGGKSGIMAVVAHWHPKSGMARAVGLHERGGDTEQLQAARGRLAEIAALP